MSRTYTPPLRSSNPPGPSGNFTAAQVDAIATGLAGVANAGAITKLVANSTARLALGSAVQVGDFALETSTSNLYTLTALPPSTSGNWTAVNSTSGVTSVNTRGGAVTLTGTDIPVFGASGGGHAPGAVPDPGSSAGSTRLLREDGVWAAPPGGVAPWLGTLTPPNPSAFTWVSQGTASATLQTSQCTFLPNNASAGRFASHLRQAYSGNKRAVMGFNFLCSTASAIDERIFIMVGDASGKLITLGLLLYTGWNTVGITIDTWASPTAIPSNLVAMTTANYSSPLFFSIQDDGTNLIFSASVDNGQNWDPIYSNARGAYLSSPAYFGFGGDTNTAGTGLADPLLRMNIVHWDVH